MTIDLKARAKLVEATRWLVGARITNFQFDDSIPSSDDPVIREVYRHFLWLQYCDLHEYRLAGPYQLEASQRDTAVRCVLFLKSGLACLWPVLSRVGSLLLQLGNLSSFGLAGRAYARRIWAAGEMAYWPFLSKAQYARALASPAYLCRARAVAMAR